MIYLSSPYSDPDAYVQFQRWQSVMKAYVALTSKGYINIFSPIMHCHSVAQEYDLPGDAEYWKQYDTHFVRKSDKMFVLCIEGWAKSKGVMSEIALAKQLYIPISYVDIAGNFLIESELPS